MNPDETLNDFQRAYEKLILKVYSLEVENKQLKYKLELLETVAEIEKRQVRPKPLTKEEKELLENEEE